MVVHQAESVNLKSGFLARSGQGLEEILAAHVTPADRLLAVSPALDMVNGAGMFDSQLSRHVHYSQFVIHHSRGPAILDLQAA